MPVIAQRASSALVAAALVVVTAARGSAQQGGGTGPGQWATFLEAPELSASIDTSRLVSNDSGTLVWLRFDYAHPQPPVQHLTTPYRRVEIHENVDCDRRRVRDYTMQLVDTSGGAHDGSELVQTSWQPFATHPLTVNLFNLVCGVLDSIRPHDQPRRS